MRKKTISFGVSASLLTVGALLTASCEKPQEKPNINTQPVSPEKRINTAPVTPKTTPEKTPTTPTTDTPDPNTTADMGAAKKPTDPTNPPKVDPNIKINTIPVKPKPKHINTAPILKKTVKPNVNTRPIKPKPKPRININPGPRMPPKEAKP